MPDSARAASLLSICAAPPDAASHHVASFRSRPSLRKRYPCLTGVHPAGGRDDRGATRSARALVQEHPHDEPACKHRDPNGRCPMQ